MFHGLVNQILDLTVTAGKHVIPGHGRLCDAAYVAYYRDMVTSFVTVSWT